MRSVPSLPLPFGVGQVTVAPYTFDAPAERILEAKARGAFLALALIGTAIAWGELVVSSRSMAHYVPHPCDVWEHEKTTRTRDIRRWNRARLP